MIKKLSIVSLLLAFILVFTACSSGSSGSSSEKKSSTKKTLRIVNDASYPPFETLEKGKMVGFDVDVIKALAKAAGYKYKLENVGWDPVFAELKSKTADMSISAISITEDREKTYDFSNPYYRSINEIMVPKSSKIKSAQDLKGKTVAVQQGTTGQYAVEKVLGKNNPKIKKFKTVNLAIMEMLNHGADAVVADNGVMDYYVKNNPGKNLKTVGDEKTFDGEFYGMMYPKDSKLKATFDKAIKKIIDDGTYSKIYKKWFDKEPDLDKLQANN
ncbi:basic amino acid ABC transporter substrate-binding protein [Sporolactobacillus inulinus]|uniref:Glutamine ABC transporter substrate-binding protein n=1 Tax=Sporolactobacillus inulinus CASD TaxID=1069536 RepID=A0A0U1QN43_9BACL|nr:basic amino acid ABC transporter substrate-binding protein [Sporolactobacillus inulinus]KLI02228.1 glutamine ABC transporter substrate-binding protein [Sporolactobacillus inulinus CASD]GEB78107.1 basic amino acid ABC transporter substrate-binding protein [Sporolactobacillus inulinus]